MEGNDGGGSVEGFGSITKAAAAITERDWGFRLSIAEVWAQSGVKGKKS